MPLATLHGAQRSKPNVILFRRIIARMVGCVILSVVSLGAIAAEAAEQPNILFIFADDWGWGDLSCHGHPYVKTPNIDRLAQRGDRLSSLHRRQRRLLAQPDGGDDRAFPGSLQHRRALRLGAEQCEAQHARLAESAVLRSCRGFSSRPAIATAHFGKWHLSNNMIPDSPLPSEYGYDEYGAFNCAGEQMPVHEDARNAHRLHREEPSRAETVLHQPVDSRTAHAVSHRAQSIEWRFRDLEEPRQHLRLGAVPRRRPDRRSAGRARPPEADRQHARHLQLGQRPGTSRPSDGTRR